MLLALGPIVLGLMLAVIATLFMAVEAGVRMVAAATKVGIAGFHR